MSDNISWANLNQRLGDAELEIERLQAEVERRAQESFLAGMDHARTWPYDRTDAGEVYEDWKLRKSWEASEVRCRCDMRTKLVGDGCQYCNPDYWERFCAGDEDDEPGKDDQ